MKIMSDLNSLFYWNWCCLIESDLWINVIILWLLTFVICQEMANYKEERIVVGNPIYIIFVILYVILLLDFVTLSRVRFLEFDFDFNYIYISCLSSYLLYIDFAHSFVRLFSTHSSSFSLLSQLIVFAMYVFIV